MAEVRLPQPEARARAKAKAKAKANTNANARTRVKPQTIRFYAIQIAPNGRLISEFETVNRIIEICAKQFLTMLVTMQ